MTLCQLTPTAGTEAEVGAETIETIPVGRKNAEVAKEPVKEARSAIAGEGWTLIATRTAAETLTMIVIEIAIAT